MVAAAARRDAARAQAGWHRPRGAPRGGPVRIYQPAAQGNQYYEITSGQRVSRVVFASGTTDIPDESDFDTGAVPVQWQGAGGWVN